MTSKINILTSRTSAWTIAISLPFAAFATFRMWTFCCFEDDRVRRPRVRRKLIVMKKAPRYYEILKKKAKIEIATHELK